MRRRNRTSLRTRVGIVSAFVAGLTVAHLLDGGEATGAPGLESFRGLIAKRDPSVVHVTTKMEDDRVPQSRDDAVGAGFVLRADGWIVTSRHVLQGARRVFVDVLGRGVHEARIAGVDDATDVAVLKIPLDGLTPMPIGESRTIAKGDWVLAAGSPFRLPRSWSVGIVGGIGRSGLGVRLSGYEDFIQTDAASNVGNSGGPLVSTTGQAVGMMTAILSRTGRSEGVGLAVPIEIVVKTALELQAGRPVSRPSLGIIVREVAAGAGRREAGLAITRFQAGSTGPAGGLRAGDVIVHVDGVPTLRTADLQRAVWGKPKGAALTVIFYRGGQRLQTTVRSR